VIVIAAVVALAAIPAHSGAAGLQSCGGSVRAAVVPCDKAKRIATEYAKTRTRSLQGFVCSSRRRGERINARCALDEKLVLFSFRA
jgi:hypothetical protein